MSSALMGIDEYLRDRLMPVEGVIPHLPGIEMYADAIPGETVGGDLFEYINFQQRYDSLAGFVALLSMYTCAPSFSARAALPGPRPIAATLYPNFLAY